MKMSRFENMIEEVKKDIEVLIKEPSLIPSYMKVSQLEMIVEELNKMKLYKNSKLFFPYYPKGIADSWNYNDELGEKLWEVLDEYEKI